MHSVHDIKYAIPWARETKAKLFKNNSIYTIVLRTMYAPVSRAHGKYKVQSAKISASAEPGNAAGTSTS